MIRALILCQMIVISLFATDKLEVTADNFTHIEAQRKAIFEGHAHAVNGKSEIDAQKFIILFDENNRAIEYRAISNVKFEIVKPDQHVKGRCDNLLYRVEEETYRLRGNAKIVDLLNGREMSGDEVYLDNKQKKASAKSDRKRPVRFIFKMKDVEKKKEGDSGK